MTIKMLRMGLIALNIKTKGLILKQTSYGESGKILTVLTEEYGIISVNARGVRRYKSRQSAAAQVFCYNEFVLFASKGFYSLMSADIIESFYNLRNNIDGLSLASYLADITYTAMQPSNPDKTVLQMLLNSLYAISEGCYSLDKIKCVYEIRLISQAGFMPQLKQCGVCEGKENIESFSISLNSIICKSCIRPQYDCFPLSPTAYKAFYYIVSSPEKKIFSFDVHKECIAELNTISERYVSKHLERRFSSLEYYLSIKSEDN